MCNGNTEFKKIEYDPVTGLYSMYTMLSLLERNRLEESKHHVQKCRYLLYFNLNKFKLYNNYYGLQAGNECLKKIGSILRDIFETQMVSRFADDHFVVLYEGEDVTARVRAAHDCIEHINDNFRLQISAGIYQSKRDVPSNIACDYAKLACDEVRGNVVNYYCEYTAKLQDDLKMRKYIMDNVDKAIENGWIKIYYQPVVRSLTQKCCSMEALTRWVDPVYGFLSPGIFIPVLEKNNLIYKVDLYVIHEVARHMRDLKKLGREVLPVSINLSRMDFTVFNPCEEINKMVVKYELLREWINIEITESTMMVDPERIRHEIDGFHASGFQVWMDDFGSGYSSLNCLKDFDFDEIKIDMGFVKGMNERSKVILKAVIAMAKELGIHTLAEGVETREQFNFLRKLGCERIQGYYFGRPEPYDEMRKHLYQQGIFPESRLQRVFFDKIGNVNFMTDGAMELLYYSQGKLRTLFMNDTYQRQRFGRIIEDYQEIDKLRELDISSTYRSVLRLVESAIDNGATDSSDMVYEGRYYRVTMKLLNRDKEGCVLLSTSTDITHDEQSKLRTTYYDKVMRHIFNVYEELYILNYAKQKLHIVSSRNYAKHLVGEDLPILTMETFIRKNVYFQDQQIFRDFIDRDKIVARLRKTHQSSLGELVRMRDRKGSYRWMSLGLLTSPDKQDSYAVIGMWASLLPTEKQALRLVDRIMDSDISHSSEQQEFLRLSSYWRTLMEQSKIKFFWKDKQRRFLGVSQAFLDFYHFDSDKSVLGKTDEEVGFNVNDERFRQCEEAVLKEGRVVENNVGTNIVNGTEKNIINSKLPVYENGKIIGLIGYFFDADSLMPKLETIYRAKTIDRVTGFMNIAGFIEMLTQYCDQWQQNQHKFALTMMDIPAYDTVYQSYGEEVADALMNEIGKKISHYFGYDQIIARISGRKFGLLKRNAEWPALRHQLVQCIQEIEKIHEINGYSCTIFVHCGTAMSSECTAIFELLQLADSRLGPLTENDDAKDDEKAEESAEHAKT